MAKPITPDPWTDTAQNLAGFDGQVDGVMARVRRPKGDALYHTVIPTDGGRYRLDRLDGASVYVDADTELTVEIAPPTLGQYITGGFQ